MTDTLGRDTVFAAFDFETTGFSRAKGARLTQVAVTRFVSAWNGHTKPVSEAWTYVNPESHILQAGDWDPAHPGERLTEHNAPGAITKTTDEDVKYAPTETEAIAAFKALVGNRPLVGHNIDMFDMRFLTDIDPSFAGHLTFDTMRIARAVHPGLDSYELNDLVKAYAISFVQNDPHQASSDTSATALLFNTLIKEAENLPSDRLAALREKFNDQAARPGMYAFFHQVVEGNGMAAPETRRRAVAGAPKRAATRRIRVTEKAVIPVPLAAPPGRPAQVAPAGSTGRPRPN